MKNKIAVIVALFLTFCCGFCFAEEELLDGVYAEIVTNKGNILLNLEYEKAPLTVTNFVGLAEGTLDGAKGKNYYDGLIFHRVVQGYIIQAGCPFGTGIGGPGYTFPNEIVPDLKHDKPGVLAMANAGPDTNGSQFYITMLPIPGLDKKYSVFGNVVNGQEVVEQIVEGDRIQQVRIVRKGDKAQAFIADQHSFDVLLKESKTKKTDVTSAAIKKSEEQESFIQKKWPKMKTTRSGLRYVVTEEGESGAKPQKGAMISAHYTGYFLDGRVFDSSERHGAPIQFVLGKGQVIKGWDEAFATMTRGEKRTIIIPPGLGYGARANGPIPANSTLVFDVELVGFSE